MKVRPTHAPISIMYGRSPLKQRGMGGEPVKDRVVGGAAVLCTLAALASPAQAAAPPGPWDAFNLSPASRSVQATGVLKSGGDVTNAAGVTNGGVTSIGPNGYVTL